MDLLVIYPDSTPHSFLLYCIHFLLTTFYFIFRVSMFSSFVLILLSPPLGVFLTLCFWYILFSFKVDVRLQILFYPYFPVLNLICSLIRIFLLLFLLYISIDRFFASFSVSLELNIQFIQFSMKCTIIHLLLHLYKCIFIDPTIFRITFLSFIIISFFSFQRQTLSFHSLSLIYSVV